jgi:hypothetical protein
MFLRLSVSFGRLIVLFEMALHPNDEGEGRSGDFLTSPEQETTTLLLDDRSLELKQRMFDHLVTQRRSLEDSELDAEKFRQSKKYDFTAPPQDGPLHYENLAGSISGDEWVSFANEALRTLFPQKAVAH